MKFSRVWCMADLNTFKVKPIGQLVTRYVGDGGGWIDPFAGDNSPAEFTNDINPVKKAKDHLHALDWSAKLNGGTYKGVLYDPPYSLRQVKECYDSLGLEMSFEESKKFPSNVKDVLAPKVEAGGLAICCGWDSIGFGKNRGFELVEIMLVCHGGRHNDTIVTVERKGSEMLG